MSLVREAWRICRAQLWPPLAVVMFLPMLVQLAGEEALRLIWKLR